MHSTTLPVVRSPSVLNGAAIAADDLVAEQYLSRRLDERKSNAVAPSSRSHTVVGMTCGSSSMAGGW
jgi:hypothetical protein